jgi:hypothetical protein
VVAMGSPGGIQRVPVCQPIATLAPATDFRQAGRSSLRVMPRPRYRQDPLPLGDATPPPTLYGPEQPLPAGLERSEKGLLPVVPLGLLFEGVAAPEAREHLEAEG